MPLSKRVLIVDDDLDTVGIVKVCLENEGYSVGTASTGDEALSIMAKEEFDIIVLDVVMPDMDGYTFLRHLRSDPHKKDTPVVVVTGKPGMKEIFEIEGVKYTIDKPFENKDLLSKIREVLSDGG